MKLKITYRDPKDLIPYANNAKTHSDEQISKIAASMKEFGFNAPVLTDGDNGIIAGHGRVQAAIKLNLSEVPTVDLSHLSEVQKKAYILADNRLGEIGTDWDLDLVQVELEALKEVDFEVELSGFDVDAFVGEISAEYDRDIADREGDANSLADDVVSNEPEDATKPKGKQPMMFPVYAMLSRPDYDDYREMRGNMSDSDFFLEMMEAYRGA
jgi:ParB-like chromosome segregation protein Spo0J